MRGLVFRLLAGIAAICVAVAGYVSAPFWTAWSIREAVTQADTAYLARKVDWGSVRETMRQSMLRTALDLPDPGVAEIPVPRRSLYERLKDRVRKHYAPRIVDKMVASYVSAEGLPRLYDYRRTYGAATGEGVADSKDFLTRFRQVWSRVKRAEFRSLSEFAIEIEDQFSAERSYHAVLELKALEWILTELSIRSTSETMPVAGLR